MTEYEIPAPRVFCNRKQMLTSSVNRIITDGGEGVILRKPGSVYEHGRSTSLVKLKVIKEKKEKKK